MLWAFRSAWQTPRSWKRRMQRPIAIQVTTEQRAVAQALGERAHRRQALGDDVAGVGGAGLAVAGAHRCGHRQAGAVQPVGQLPLGEGSRALRIAPAIAIRGQLCHEAAAAVVSQHQAVAVGLDEWWYRAPARCRRVPRAPASKRSSNHSGRKLPAREVSYSMAPPAAALRFTSGPSAKRPLTVLTP